MDNQGFDNVKGITNLAEQLGAYRRKLLDAGFTSPEMMILITKLQDQFVLMGYNAALTAASAILKKDDPTAQ